MGPGWSGMGVVCCTSSSRVGQWEGVLHHTKEDSSSAHSTHTCTPFRISRMPQVGYSTTTSQPCSMNLFLDAFRE